MAQGLTELFLALILIEGQKMNRFSDITEKPSNFLDYIITQGLKGHHILFDNDQIRRAFEKKDKEFTRLSTDKIQEVRNALQEILTRPNMEDKKEFIAQLPEDTRHVLILLYFQILEKNLLSQKVRPH